VRRECIYKQEWEIGVNQIEFQMPFSIHTACLARREPELVVAFMLKFILRLHFPTSVWNIVEKLSKADKYRIS